jgi:hypothetical protein
VFSDLNDILIGGDISARSADRSVSPPPVAKSVVDKPSTTVVAKREYDDDEDDDAAAPISYKLASFGDYSRPGRLASSPVSSIDASAALTFGNTTKGPESARYAGYTSMNDPDLKAAALLNPAPIAAPASAPAPAPAPISAPAPAPAPAPIPAPVYSGARTVDTRPVVTTAGADGVPSALTSSTSPALMPNLMYTSIEPTPAQRQQFQAPAQAPAPSFAAPVNVQPVAALAPAPAPVTAPMPAYVPQGYQPIDPHGLPTAPQYQQPPYPVPPYYPGQPAPPVAASYQQPYTAQPYYQYPYGAAPYPPAPPVPPMPYGAGYPGYGAVPPQAAYHPYNPLNPLSLSMNSFNPYHSMHMAGPLNASQMMAQSLPGLPQVGSLSSGDPLLHDLLKELRQAKVNTNLFCYSALSTCVVTFAEYRRTLPGLRASCQR